MALLLPDVGKALLIARLAAGSFYLAWGTGAGTVDHTYTAPFGELGPRISPTSVSIITTVSNNDTLRIFGTMTNTTGNPITITNACVMDAHTGGNVFIASDFVNLGLMPSDGLQFDWRWQSNG